MSGSQSGVNIFPPLSGNNLIDQFGEPNQVNNQIVYYPIPQSLETVASSSWNIAQWGQTLPVETSNYTINNAALADAFYGPAAYAWTNPGSPESVIVYNSGSASQPDYIYSLSTGSTPQEADIAVQAVGPTNLPASENNLVNLTTVNLNLKVTQSNWTANTPIGITIGIIAVYNGAGNLPVVAGFTEIVPFTSQVSSATTYNVASQSAPPRSDQNMQPFIYSNNLSDTILPILPEDAHADPITLTYNVNKYVQQAVNSYFIDLPTSEQTYYDNLANWSINGLYAGEATYNQENGATDSGNMTAQYSNVSLTVNPDVAYNPNSAPASTAVIPGPQITFLDGSTSSPGAYNVIPAYSGITGQVEGATMTGANGTFYDQYVYNGGDSVALTATGSSAWYFGGGNGIDTLTGNNAVDTMQGSGAGTQFRGIEAGTTFLITGGSNTVSAAGSGNLVSVIGSASVIAAAGNDTISLQGTDVVTITSGDVRVKSYAGANTILASGSSTVVASVVAGNTGSISFINISTVSQVLEGNGSSVTAFGGLGGGVFMGGTKGSNSLVGGVGAVTLVGGGADDILMAGYQSSGSSLSGISQNSPNYLYGGPGNETLMASSATGTNLLAAGTGPSIIYSDGSGAQNFFGNIGSSTMTGSTATGANNVYFFGSSSGSIGGNDLITNFNLSSDQLNAINGTTIQSIGKTTINGSAAALVTLSDGTLVSLKGIVPNQIPPSVIGGALI